MLRTNTLSNTKQSYRAAWKKRESTIKVVTPFDKGVIPTRQEFGAEPNVLAIGTASTTTPSSSTDPSSCAIVTQTSTSQAGVSSVCYNRLNSVKQCSLILNEQWIFISYLRESNLFVPLPISFAVTKGNRPSFLNSGRDNQNQKDGYSSQAAKRSGETKNINERPTKNQVTRQRRCTPRISNTT